METSLHRQLKAMYADDEARVEVPLGDYRIDVVTDTELVEIQHGSLAAIRNKVGRLLKEHRVLVVKPLVVRKRLVKLDARGGRVVDRRFSPKRGSVFSLFDELVYFTRVFPHRNLVLETPLVEIEEVRFPGHGKRRRRRDNDFQIEDQHLVEVQGTYRFRTAGDLLSLLPRDLPRPFHTGNLAESLGVERWIAQRIAYCLRETGGAQQVGKQGNAWLYQLSDSNKSKPPTTAKTARRKKKSQRKKAG